jgi:hypothetical protein
MHADLPQHGRLYNRNPMVLAARSDLGAECPISTRSGH